MAWLSDEEGRKREQDERNRAEYHRHDDQRERIVDSLSKLTGETWLWFEQERIMKDGSADMNPANTGFAIQIPSSGASAFDDWARDDILRALVEKGFALSPEIGTIRSPEILAELEHAHVTHRPEEPAINIAHSVEGYSLFLDAAAFTNGLDDLEGMIGTLAKQQEARLRKQLNPREEPKQDRPAGEDGHNENLHLQKRGRRGAGHDGNPLPNTRW